MSFVVRKAEHVRRPLRLNLLGPSGGGKTFSALALATSIVPANEVVLIDTERRSGALYSDAFPGYLHLEFEPPYAPQRYEEAIDIALGAGAKCIIVDSLSHAWSGPGGLLEQMDEAGARNRGNTFNAWKFGTPIQNSLIDKLLAVPAHLIVTMRVKTKYTVEQQNGKSVPRKVGTVPIQREGLEYEFDIVGYMDPFENRLVVEKTRCSELAGKSVVKPGAQIAKVLLDWLDAGAPEEPRQAPVQQPKPATQTQAPAQRPQGQQRPAQGQQQPAAQQRPPAQTQAPAAAAQQQEEPPPAPAPAAQKRQKTDEELADLVADRARKAFLGSNGAYLGDEVVLTFLEQAKVIEPMSGVTLADLATQGREKLIACGKAISEATPDAIGAALEAYESALSDEVPF